MIDLIEMFLDFSIISAVVCVVSFLLWKRGGDRAAGHLTRLRRYSVIGIACAILGGIGELWLNMK